MRHLATLWIFTLLLVVPQPGAAACDSSPFCKNDLDFPDDPFAVQTQQWQLRVQSAV